MTDPWIIAARNADATRWLDDLGVALQARSNGAATASATPPDVLIGLIGSSSGRASVSGAVQIVKAAAGSSSGSSSINGVLGSPIGLSASSAGTSMVTFDPDFVYVGIGHALEGFIAGSATALANLTVVIPYRPTGVQVSDGDPEHPSSSARSDGANRRFFTPRSTGLTGQKA